MKVKTGYNVPYWWYDIRGFFIFILCYQDFLPTTINFFSKNFSHKHLEVAVGSGSFMKLCLDWRRLFGRTKSTVGGFAFDYTFDMLEGAKKVFKNNNMWSIEKSDVCSLRFDSESFETINVANAFHCFASTDIAMKELCRVLAVSGTMAINVVTPPRGNSVFRFIAEGVLSWGRKNEIVERPISRIEMYQLIELNSLSIIEEKWRGNNLLLLLKK